MPVQTVPLLTLSISADDLFKFKRTRELTEHIVTTLKTPLVERATHPPSQVREKESVNICMYVHTQERHEREREKETERQRNTGRCGVKEPVSAAKTAYTGFSTGHRISSQPVCQTQIRKPKRAERSDSELQIFHLCRNLGDTTANRGFNRTNCEHAQHIVGYIECHLRGSCQRRQRELDRRNESIHAEGRRKRPDRRPRGQVGLQRDDA